LAGPDISVDPSWPKQLNSP